MTPGMVVDIGNTRVKWGRCEGDAITATCSLAHDEAAWAEQLARWEIAGPLLWALAGVKPRSLERFEAWLRGLGHRALTITLARQLPLRVALDHPDRAGIDRLLDAVAANQRRTAGTAALIVDAGTAITVDWLDESGAFAGGAILPGLQLMAKALHDHTALLPVVETTRPAPPFPAAATAAAMEVGVYWAAVGGIRAICDLCTQRVGKFDLFVTGGDGPVLAPNLPAHARPWPAMTLEGIRIAAEALP